MRSAPSDHARHPIARAAVHLGLLAAVLWFAAPAWALHWPWHQRASGAAQPVQVLAVDLHGAATAPAVGSAAPRIEQYWDRNALLLDLTPLRADGSARLAPLPGNAWPMRLEFRVRAGAIGRLEVRAAQRVIFDVPSEGAPVVLELDPGVYRANSAQITLQWSRSQSE